MLLTPERLVLDPLGRPTSLLLEALLLPTISPDLESITLPDELSTIRVLEPDVALLVAEEPLDVAALLLYVFEVRLP